ncbi:unnamed protein product [Symbiodinium necroappetens]|uniref:Uncharacterized protein n=1 Tax=Symbiodinium necroappetens TaxID=1628268 RepID=A0A812KKD7_9DINO|nr:unnamed protein product [Symbiodinium necroappetens]
MSQFEAYNCNCAVDTPLGDERLCGFAFMATENYRAMGLEDCQQRNLKSTASECEVFIQTLEGTLFDFTFDHGATIPVIPTSQTCLLYKEVRTKSGSNKIGRMVNMQMTDETVVGAEYLMEDDSAAFLQIATAGAGKLYTDLCNCEDKCPPTVQDAQHILTKSCMEHHQSNCLRLVSRLFSGSMPSDPYTRSDSLCKKIKSFRDNTQAKAKSSNFADDMLRRSIYPQAASLAEADKVTVGKSLTP